MTFSKLRYNHSAAMIEFSVLKDHEEIECRIEELWMLQECGGNPGVDWTGSLAVPLKNAFIDCWPKIEKIIAQKIQNKQFEPNGMIFLEVK